MSWSFVVMGFSIAYAQGPGSEAPPPAEGEASAEDLPWIPGPSPLDLGNDIQLQLPEGHAALLHADARKLMEDMGNVGNDALLALVVRAGGEWLLSVEYEPEGYVRDDDANELDADELFAAYRDGTEAANEERERRGFAALHVTGWTERPTYDAAVHHLTWGLSGSSSDGPSVNHFTRVLGRRGFASLQLMTDAESIETAKVELRPVVAGLSFAPGARYEDYDASTDKVAEYGLAALVLGGAGVAAGKAGLFAKLIALLLAGKKFVVIGAIALVAALRRILGGKKE